jgi:hypothetical protein
MYVETLHDTDGSGPVREQIHLTRGFTLIAEGPAIRPGTAATPRAVAAASLWVCNGWSRSSALGHTVGPSTLLVPTPSGRLEAG